MSYLLFIDESGHDHKNMPYEVRGGVALHASKLWGFIREMAALEQDCFGDRLFRYRAEVKGCKLLDKDRFRWAHQNTPLDPLTRRQNATSFLNKGLAKEQPTRIEFTAYGQACLSMADGILRLLAKYDSRVFASIIPVDAVIPELPVITDFLRKDHVFLLERYFYFLDAEKETGIMVMDETETTLDRRFVLGMERYYTKTSTGQDRLRWIVPSPFFVESDMAYPVQAADLCIYCINLGMRINTEMDKPVRQEIAEGFIPYIRKLQWQGQVVAADGMTYTNYGVVFVPDPYQSRK